MANYHEVELGFLFLTSTLSTDSTLKTLAPGGVWRGNAPAETSPGVPLPTPFVVMSFHTGTDSVTMNGYRMLTRPKYLIKAVGPASQTNTLHQAAAQVDRLLGGPPGTPVSGAITVNSVQEGQMLSCYREEPFHQDEIVNGELWTNVGGFYATDVEQVAT